MAVPTFVDKGPISAEQRNSRPNISFSIPTTTRSKDLLLLVCQSANEVIDTPVGWTEIGNQNLQARSSPLLTRLAVFYKFASYTDSGGTITIATNQDHTMGQVLVFRYVDRLGFASTENYSSSSGVTTSLGSALNIMSIDSTVKPKRTDCLVLTIAAIARDFNSSDNFSTNAVNYNLTSVTELADQSTNVGLGGGIAVWSGVNKTLSTVGLTTAIYDGSSLVQPFGSLILNLRPSRNLTHFS